MIKARFFVVFLSLSFGVLAQDVNPSVWTLHNGRYDLNDRFYLHSEVHFRFTDGVSTFQQFLFRPQLSYILDDHLIFSAGYTYIHNYPYGEVSIPDDLSENNLWEEVIMDGKIGSIQFLHRIRVEHRWIDDLVENNGVWEKEGTIFTNRIRYRLTAQYAINEKWTLLVYDEFFAPLDLKTFEININQNWLFLGAKYKLNNSWSIQTGFQEQYLELSNGTTQNNPTWLTAVNYHLN